MNGKIACAFAKPFEGCNLNNLFTFEFQNQEFAHVNVSSEAPKAKEVNSLVYFCFSILLQIKYLF